MIARSLSVTLAITLAASAASAQTDTVAAQALFDEAKSLMAKGNAAAACPKFAESQRLDPGVGTLLNLGECYDKIGRTARAWSTFRDAESIALRENQKDRARYAHQRAAQMEPKLVRLTIEVSEDATVAALEITRDGERIGAAAWGLAVPIDPGEHVITASALGFKTITVSVTASHDPLVVRIPRLEAEPPPPVTTVASPEPTPPIEQPRPQILELPPAPHETNNPLRTSGLAVGGVGIAGLALGGIFGVLAIDRENSAHDAGCDATTCPTQGGLDLSSSAKSFAFASDIAFIAGGALVITGVVLLLVAPRSSVAHVARVALEGFAF